MMLRTIIIAMALVLISVPTSAFLFSSTAAPPAECVYEPKVPVRVLTAQSVNKVCHQLIRPNRVFYVGEIPDRPWVNRASPFSTLMYYNACVRSMLDEDGRVLQATIFVPPRDHPRHRELLEHEWAHVNCSHWH